MTAWHTSNELFWAGCGLTKCSPLIRKFLISEPRRAECAAANDAGVRGAAKDPANTSDRGCGCAVADV